MTDVLFTHSYFLRFDPKEWKAMMPYLPLGTLTAAAHVRRQGHSVALFDSILAEGEHGLARALAAHRPRVLVIYDDDFNYLTKMCLTRMREAAFTMIRMGREAGCDVIVHGSDPSDHAREYLDRGARAVVIGEGEHTLAELVDAVLAGADPSGIPGLALPVAQQVVRTARRHVEADLDSFPLPARDLADIEMYRSAWRKRHGYFSMNIVTTRGCPFHCNWCAKPIYGQLYNSRSPESVVEEMAILARDYRPDHLWFCDDIFGLKPGWTDRFAELLSAQKFSIPFKCLSRADLLLKGTTVADLARSGCRSVWMGAESGSQKILDAMEKGITVSQIRDATQLLRRHGIRVGFFLQYGYTGETRADIDLTLAMVRSCRPDDIGISVSYPLPGTKFYEAVRNSLGAKRNWVDSRDLDPMLPTTYPRQFYRSLHAVTHKKLRIWQGVDVLKEAVAHPSRLNASSARRLAATAYHALTLPRHAMRLNALGRHRNGA
jgi:radical SAM superfamily enzyme YgiQ (UPF0313 family)